MIRTHHSIDAIVEEQVRRWQFESQRQRECGLSLARPVITLSRQHGSGGVELARRVAQRLGFSFWHKEILHEVATRTDMSERLLASFDEHRRNVIAELVGNLVLVNQAQSDYVRALAKVMHAIATHGGAVIVGRGAHYLLDPEAILRVLVVAPLEVRVKNLVAVGQPEAEARRAATAIDRDRANFIRATFHHEVEDPLDYDLALNLGRLSLERSEELVIAAVSARFADRL